MHRSRSLQLGLYTTFLLYAAPLGFLTYWVSFGEEQSDCTLTPYFAAYVAIWGTVFLEMWKRQQITFVMEWGMEGFEQAETDRAAFKGQQVLADGVRWKKKEERKIERINTCQSSIIDGQFLRPTHPSIVGGLLGRFSSIPRPFYRSPELLVSGVCVSLDATFAFRIHQPVNKNPNICPQRRVKSTDVTNPVDGSPWIYFSPEKALERKLVSNVVTILFIFFVMFVVFMIFQLKGIVNVPPYRQQFTIELGSLAIELGALVPTVFNAASIQIFTKVWKIVSLALNSFENHRTDTQFEDALIAKTFAFEFVNKYAACFYAAFFKKYFVEGDPCDVSSWNLSGFLSLPA